MGKYDDIINLPRPVSKNHKQMSIYDRSAQFAPFAALVGYDESISEASRTVDDKLEITKGLIQNTVNGFFENRNVSIIGRHDHTNLFCKYHSCLKFSLLLSRLYCILICLTIFEPISMPEI